MVDNYKIEVMKFFTERLRIEVLGFWESPLGCFKAFCLIS